MITCPDCGAENDESARFCDNCGRRLDDVKAAPQATAENARVTTEERDPAPVPLGTPVADDGLPVGKDLDGIPGGERILWEGRPSKLWSPRMALTNRYRLTNQRLIVEFGFIGRRTEEIDLFRVNDVGVKQNPFERMVGIGDIYIASADTTTPHRYMHNIKDSVRIKDLLREVARQERHRRRVLVREDV